MFMEATQMLKSEAIAYLKSHGYNMNASEFWMTFGCNGTYNKSELDFFLKTAGCAA